VLARLADGGMRDGLSLLDQCASATTGELTAEKVYSCLGIAGIRECSAMMTAIAEHDSKKVLTLLNESYAQGKDMGALLDELACLTRDLMILQSAPKEGISLLSGVASDTDVKHLAAHFTSGELVYMMNTIQKTMASFTRSASRRMDTELCLLNLCQPELSLDPQGLNARISRVEDQLKNGSFTVAAAPKLPEEPEELPPMPCDEDAPPAPMEDEPAEPVPDQTPVGFWPDLASDIRKDLKPPVSGFFAPTPNAPVQGALVGSTLELRCANSFTVDVVNKPEILSLVARKASARLGRSIQVKAVDKNAVPAVNKSMEQLLRFGQAHSDVVKIRKGD